MAYHCLQKNHLQRLHTSKSFISYFSIVNGDDDDFLGHSSDSIDLSNLSPERNPRSQLTSAKSIAVIREDEEEEDDVLVELSQKFKR